MVKYFKILNEKLNHNRFQYKEGLNIDTVPFNTKEYCGPGGLHFTNKKNIFHYLHLGTLIADVKIPNNAKVYKYETAWKVDQIILSNIRLVEEFVSALTRKEIFEFIEVNASIIRFVKEQTPELCLVAVKNSEAFQFVKEQTPELCLFAVKQDGFSLRYVKEQTSEICLEAVKECGMSLQFVKKQTPSICYGAVKEDGNALRFVKNRTSQIVFEAVKQSYLFASEVKKFLK